MNYQMLKRYFLLTIFREIISNIKNLYKSDDFLRYLFTYLVLKNDVIACKNGSDPINREIIRTIDEPKERRRVKKNIKSI